MVREGRRNSESSARGFCSPIAATNVGRLTNAQSSTASVQDCQNSVPRLLPAQRGEKSEGKGIADASSRSAVRAKCERLRFRPRGPIVWFRASGRKTSEGKKHKSR
jgi:hypothetical protein